MLHVKDLIFKKYDFLSCENGDYFFCKDQSHAVLLLYKKTQKSKKTPSHISDNWRQFLQNINFVYQDEKLDDSIFSIIYSGSVAN